MKHKLVLLVSLAILALVVVFTLRPAALAHAHANPPARQPQRDEPASIALWRPDVKPTHVIKL